MATACLSLFLFAVSAALLPAALLRAADDLGVSAEVMSWAVATQFIACFIAIIAGGVLSDRLGMKPVLLGASAMLSLGALLWTQAESLPAVHLAAALMGMGGGVLESLGSALLAALYPERRALVLNLSQAVYCGGAVAGPALMAILLPLGVSWRSFFAAEAILGLILLGLYRATPMPPPASASGDGGVMACLHRLRQGSVLILAVALFCYVLVESGVAFFLNLHLQQRLGAPERWAVLGISAFWAAMLIGRLICAALPDRLFSARVLGLMALAGAASLAAQSVIDDWLPALALFALSGLLISGLWPGIVALTARTHPRHIGSTMGGVIAVGSLGVAAAPMVASLVASLGGGIHFFLVLAAALLAVAPLLRAVPPPSP